MNELLFKICALAVVGAMTVALLRKFGSDFAVMVKICAGIVLVGAVVLSITPIVNYVNELSEEVGNGRLSESVELMLRVLAVALITHVSANICRDCGESTLASYLELGGKVEILVLSLPMVKGIVDLAVGML